MPTVIQLAQQFRKRLEAQELDTAERMALAYNRIYTSLLDDLQKLADKIALMEKPTRDQIFRLSRIQQLLAQVEEQTNRFVPTVENEIEIIQRRAISQAIEDVINLVEASLGDDASAIIGSFTTLPVDAIETAAGLFGEDSPLTERLEKGFGEYVASQVENNIITGVALGKNPREVYRILQRNLQQSLGSGLTSALTTIRTAQVKSYQLASHASYQANSDIVTGWIWYSALQPGRTCMSCIAKHGTLFPITQRLNDHHNGRCTPIPQTRLSAPVEPGQDWFKRQSVTTQRQMMGNATYKAWRKKEFEFSELSRPYDDPVYGELIREASLKDILGAKAKAYYT